MASVGAEVGRAALVGVVLAGWQAARTRTNMAMMAAKSHLGLLSLIFTGFS
jgi:hypothetical protein